MLNEDKTIERIYFSKKYNDQILIGNQLISSKSKPFYIAEIGNNHNGSMELASELIKSAKESGANAVKFQSRKKELYKTDAADLGSEYVNDLISRFNLNSDDLNQLATEARSYGLAAIITPFDIESLEQINPNSWDAIKIASVDLVNLELIEACKEKKLPLILSTGMSSEVNIVTAYELVSDHMPGFCFLHCNSTYPAPYSDIHLEFINTLKMIVGPMVGYSGHELGYHIANSAIIYGANVIEKHFTFDKKMIGNDHKVSLVPAEFAAMTLSGKEIYEAIGIEKGPNRCVTQGERINKSSLGKSYVYNKPFKKGIKIKRNHLRQIPNCVGITPEFIGNFEGMPLLKDVSINEVVQESHYLVKIDKMKLNIKSNFGVPVRFHDVNVAINKIAPKFVEYHLSFSDLDRIQEINKIEKTSVPFALHAPEQFKDDFIIDFATQNSVKKSQDLLHSVFNIGEKLKSKHSGGALKDQVIPVVLNAGGFTLDKPLDYDQKKSAFNCLCDNLLNIEIPDGFKLLCQTMPPFPWLYGGAAYHNLLTDISHVKAVAGLRPNKIGVCVDISHTAMWLMNNKSYSINNLLEYFEYADYFHVADVENERSEGLQIGHGLIDFNALATNIKSKPSNWVTEIWMGHSNSFEECVKSLKKLEKSGW